MRGWEIGMSGNLSIVMAGATGAVGVVAARTLAALPEVARLTLIGRRAAEGVAGPTVSQHMADVADPAAYAALLPGHAAAVCTVGVGQPSKVSREEFVRIDKVAVLAFAAACRDAGVGHFSLLCSVGADARSSNFYLRTKGELEDGLRALGFPRLSLFEPSVILTPQNRYGWSQGMLLAAMPLLNPLMIGGLRKFRGIPLATLGRAMALNVARPGAGEEVLRYDEIVALGG
jgi:uncharacterized protein YbjT (DUF2867 family)